MTRESVLELKSVSSGYGDMTVLRHIDLVLEPGTVTAVAGANGAGKTTLLKTIIGVVNATAGAALLGAHDVTQMPTAQRIALGVGLVPEGRGLFTTLTVSDNLRLGGRVGGLRGAQITDAIGNVVDVFPILAEKMHAKAGSLSGGQQQMLALARTLVANPRLILLDEPSMGLAPMVWAEFLTLARSFADDGKAIVLAEQKIRPVLRISDQCLVLQRGEAVYCGPASTDAAETAINRAYLEITPTLETADV